MSGYWETVSIAGKRADIFEPDEPKSERAVIFLHGYAGRTLMDNDVYSYHLNRHGLRTICPHGSRSWWLPEHCPDFDEQMTSFNFVREHITGWVRQQWRTAPNGLAISGISMGGQGALQLAYRHAREFPIVAAISPAIDLHLWFGQSTPLDYMFDSAEAARQQSAILHLHPLNWPREQLLVCDPADNECFPATERLASKLSSSGVPFESDLITSGGGHSWQYFDRMAPRVVEFLANALQRESLRIL